MTKGKDKYRLLFMSLLLFVFSMNATKLWAEENYLTKKDRLEKAAPTIKEIEEDEEKRSQTSHTITIGGEKLGDEERKMLTEKLASYTGLSKDRIETNNHRISWIEFTKHLLGDKRKLVGRMDTTIIGIRSDPTHPYPRYDPSLDPLFGPFSSAVNGYIRNELQYESDLVYEFLNEEVNNQWDWSSGLIKKQGYVDVSQTLRDALAVNNDLKILIASGYYDLATPYFATEYTISHMWLEKQRSNISMNYYESGHMIYTHLDEHKRLFQDVLSFYQEAL